MKSKKPTIIAISSRVNHKVYKDEFMYLLEAMGVWWTIDRQEIIPLGTGRYSPIAFAFQHLMRRNREIQA